MSLLEELACNVQKKGNLNVDFHNHLQTGSSFRKKSKTLSEKLKNLFFDEGFDSLSDVLKKSMKTNLDVLYITNYADSRYEDWTSEEQIENARKQGYEMEKGDYYTLAKKGTKIIVIGKSQEVPTKQGHLLVAGLKRNKKITNEKSLDETLSEINDNELKIADPPYVRVEHSGILRNSKNVQEEIKKFDAIERNGNFYLPFSTSDIRTRFSAKKYNKVVVTDSDGHHPKDIGKTYNSIFSNVVNYDSELSFRDSINKAIRENKFEGHYSRIPPHRIFHHMLMIGIYTLYQKIFGKSKINKDLSN
jgi:hypothetical protein